MLNTILREFKVPNTHPGSGEMYTLPAKADYSNPVVAVIVSTQGTCYLNFESKDGNVGTHSTGARPTKERVEIAPNNQQITKIVLYYDSAAINGFKFYANDVLISQAGNLTHSTVEIPLQPGERLL